MENKKGRRGFLKAAGIVAGASAVAGTAAFSSSDKPSTDKQDTNPVKRIIPLGFQWETQDPFLFCVHHEDSYPKGTTDQGPEKKELAGRNLGSDFTVKDGWRMYHGSTVPGFPNHPHRGFETITVVRTGRVDHTDSLGASGRYGDGDVQWMTAGKGVQHAEMFPLVNQEESNPLELFQIWINLPAKDKFVEPHFKMLWADAIPIYEEDLNGKKIKAEIVAGTLGEKTAPTPPPNSWATPKEHEVAVWNIELDAEAEWTLPKTKYGVNRSVYFFKGDTLEIENETLKSYYAAEVETTKDLKLKAGKEKAIKKCPSAKGIFYLTIFYLN